MKHHTNTPAQHAGIAGNFTVLQALDTAESIEMLAAILDEHRRKGSGSCVEAALLDDGISYQECRGREIGRD